MVDVRGWKRLPFRKTVQEIIVASIHRGQSRYHFSTGRLNAWMPGSTPSRAGVYARVGITAHGVRHTRGCSRPREGRGAAGRADLIHAYLSVSSRPSSAYAVNSTPMPIEIREVVVRAEVGPEPPNVPDNTPVELPTMHVGGGPVEVPELLIRARVGPYDSGHAWVLPELFIVARIGSDGGTAPVQVRELVVRAAIPSSNTFARRVPITVQAPSFSALLGCYADYVSMPKPCTNPRASNQCAVRLSTALARCGFPMEAFPDRRRIHRPARCRIQVPHVLGAQELEEFLRSRMTGVSVHGRHGRSSALQDLRGRKGIVFFDRVNGRTDHIDLFDGEKIQNEVLYGAANAGTAGYFERAKRITFFELG